jgi:hypothetical protein
MHPNRKKVLEVDSGGKVVKTIIGMPANGIRRFSGGLAGERSAGRQFYLAGADKNKYVFLTGAKNNNEH